MQWVMGQGLLCMRSLGRPAVVAQTSVSHSLQCAWPVWLPGIGGLGSTPGSGGLSVHAGHLSA